eukprot:1313457-Pyramimonas_sp.AAC.1
MAGSSAPKRLSDRIPGTCRGPSGAAAASPSGGIVAERTSVIAFSHACQGKLMRLILRSAVQYIAVYLIRLFYGGSLACLRARAPTPY